MVDEDCHDNSLISNRGPPSEDRLSLLQLSGFHSHRLGCFRNHVMDEGNAVSKSAGLLH